MNNSTILFFLILAANVLAFFLYESRRELNTAKNELISAKFRERVMKEAQDSVEKRPMQVMIPRDAVEILGQNILQYLGTALNGPLEVPIFSREPEKEPKK